MKYIKLAVMAAAALSYSSAYAFHEGGVAYCDGCHTMHNSSGNAQMNNINGTAGTGLFQGKNFLLKGTDDSSTCLNCHAKADTWASGKTSNNYHVMTYPVPAVGTAPAERGPGGDFAWIKQTYTAVGPRSNVTNLGDRHGHNVVAVDYGMIADVALTYAPGGTYAASALSCASCHDPHARARITDATTGAIAYPQLGQAVLPIGESGSYVGNLPDANEAVGTYRFLAGANYSQLSYVNGTPFNADPPVARAPSTYNTTIAGGTGGVRVAYGAGMSEWCANCHRSIHNDNVNAGNTALIHPAGNSALLTATANDLLGNAAGTTIANIYNAYKKSGDLTGTSASSFTSTVPYEAGTKALATLDALQGTNAGPTTGTENVMCLSCHRAHAGGFPNMGRWNLQGSFITEGGNFMDAADSTQAGEAAALPRAVYQAAMYDQNPNQYAYAQRNLCNKCHAKD
jgi:hypothetical protein